MKTGNTAGIGKLVEVGGGRENEEDEEGRKGSDQVAHLATCQGCSLEALRWLSGSIDAVLRSRMIF